MTFARHRRQMWLQIVFPVAVFALIIIALAVLSTTGSRTQVGHWSNISAILVIIPVLILLLVTLVINALLIYAVARLYRVLPAYTHQAQIFIERIGDVARAWADRAAKPVIVPSSAWAGAKTVFRRLRF
ncbi:MAG TPA: hypothetical protein VHO48_03975 [Anaerolineaceae bacterium]|nr:hypothetical protein [Anaerolineaceae bacterium]